MIPDIASTLLFYLFGLVAILLAIAVVNVRRLLRAAICLMGVLVCSAGLYIMLDAEFLAGVQVLVYVGGIVILIVFAIMLTRSVDLQEDNPSLLRKTLGGAVSIGFLALSSAAFWLTDFGAKTPLNNTPANAAAPELGETEKIGHALLDYSGTGYVLPFEIISLLLLAAVLGGIVIARKTPPRGQPFTSGGDLPSEANYQLPLRQGDPDQKEGENG